jgi:3D (Asp-Asp-Asp) domain-containing protein
VKYRSADPIVLDMRSHRLLLALALLCAVMGCASAAAAPMSRQRWLTGVQLTQYFPAPEAWFHGQLVSAPGLDGPHRIDWLYSAHGLAMEGEGIGLDGRYYHIDALGNGAWVGADGRAVQRGGPPYWRAGGYWRNAQGGVTFPLDGGGWSAGAGVAYVPLAGVTFAPGPSRALTPWESIAVDPRVIPLGSWVYIPAYPAGPGHGWFLAQDTGGAVRGRHLDIYRSPPSDPNDPGQTLSAQRIYVLPPGQRLTSASSGSLARGR